MTIEHFLSFWSQHNTSIIEGLVALIVCLSLFLGYRSLFAKKSSDGGLEPGAGFDASQLEKTLQKILENQAAPKAGSSTNREAAEDMSMHVDLDANSGSSTSSAEGEKLRSALSESQKKIEQLQTQLAEVKEQGAAAGSGAEAATAAPGMSLQEKADLEAKIRDLESRLAEYEIISEDIADLSRYKEENEKLAAEIEALKSQKGAAAAAPAAVEEPAKEEPPVAVAQSQAEPISEPAPEPTPEPATEPTPGPVATEAPASPAAADDGPNLIDDELMKEFAAAVEGQKGSTGKSSEKAGDEIAPEKKTDETEALMNDFENFVSKKS